MNGKDFLNGSFGKISINGKEVAEIKDFNANVVITREDIPINGSMSLQTKMKSRKGIGSFALTKAYDRFLDEKFALLSDTDESFSIQVSTEDPDHNGDRTEYLFPVCYFTGNLPIMNWTSNECVTEKYEFVFNDQEVVNLHSRLKK